MNEEPLERTLICDLQLKLHRCTVQRNSDLRLPYNIAKNPVCGEQIMIEGGSQVESLDPQGKNASKNIPCIEQLLVTPQD